MKNRKKFENRWNKIAEKNIDFASAYKEFVDSIKFEAEILKKSNNNAYKNLVLEAVDYVYERKIANNNCKKALKDESRAIEAFRNAIGVEKQNKNSFNAAADETTLIEEEFKKELQKQSNNYNSSLKEDPVTAEFKKQIIG